MRTVQVNEDLGVVKSHADNKDEVTVDVPVEQHDINAVYAAELKTLAAKAPKEVKIVSEDQKQEDYYKVSWKSFFSSEKQADKLWSGRTSGQM